MGYYNKTKVIASTSGRPIIGSVVIVSDTAPTTRTNGDALVIGDMWWNASTEDLTFWMPDAEGVYSWTEDDEDDKLTQTSSLSRISSNQTSIWVGQTAPVADPNGVPGWHFSSDGDKIQWNLWEQDSDPEKVVTFADLRSVSVVLRNSGKRYPYISIYTRRKNDGNDANAGYRSRYVLETPQDDSGLPKIRMITSLEDNPIYSNVPHTLLTLFNPESSVGPREPDEVIKNITLSSNSGALAGDFVFTAQQLILDTLGETFHVGMDFTPVVDPNTARIYYQDSAPNVLGRKEGDLWYDTLNSTLNVWTGSWTAL